MSSRGLKSTNSTEPFVPIYQRLFEFYRSAILSHEYVEGDRIPSINELIERHNIARETAKSVLNKLADEGYIIQQAGKGSFVSKLGPLQKKWGVIVPFFSAQIEELIFYLQQEADKFGRELEHFVDYNSWEEEIRLVGRLINERYEAIIVNPTFDETQTASFYTRLKAGGTIVTLIDHSMAGAYFPYAIQSYDLGVSRGMQHLFKQSSGTLAFIKNYIWLNRNMVQELMQETFQDCIANQSKNYRPLILNNVQQISKDLIQNNHIRGFFCCDDNDAIRVVGRLKAWGFKIPEDVAIVSYGNTDLAKYFSPAITSIDSHSAEMAATAAKIIRQKLNGEDVSFSQYVLQPKLVTRET